MTDLQQAGVGDWLAPRDLTADRIERLARRMLAEPGLAQRATAVGAAERSKDIALPLETAIGELCGAREAAPVTRPAQ